MTDNKTTSLAIETHLKKFQAYLCGFLGQILPKICVEGADWWTLLVRSIPRLKGSQSSRIRSGTIRDLGKLDLVSLCGVFRHEALNRHRQSNSQNRPVNRVLLFR
jgi:hypothetical protein